MDVELRELKAADRPGIERVLRATGAFADAEIDVALELVDAGLRPHGTDDYRFVVAEADGDVAGYACWGPTPMTRGAFDLYWIAVDPARSGRGVGATLLEAVERAAAQDGARLIVAETAGKASYASTRMFYLARGYREEARLADFYAVGDDKIVYVKRLGAWVDDPTE